MDTIELKGVGDAKIHCERERFMLLAVRVKFMMW